MENKKEIISIVYEDAVKEIKKALQPYVDRIKELEEAIKLHRIKVQLIQREDLELWEHLGDGER